jgi:hypothetical protein
MFDTGNGRNDRSAFYDHVVQIREAGQQAIQNAGVVLDDILVAELSSPRADQRFGVNLVARPSQVVIDNIVAIQNYLRKWEPLQYYYPPQDLHLTFVEICFGLSFEQASSVAATVQQIAAEVLGGLPIPQMDSPILGFDAKGCALNFLPLDEGLQTARLLVLNRLRENGIQFASRYPPRSAHISIMRYIAPLRVESDEWVKFLVDAPQPVQIVWTISELWLTWGANWYGMRTRIKEVGPYRLQHHEHRETLDP